jgi:hypothetical protein
LKVHIEGAEFRVLSSSKKLDRVQMIVGEIHSYATGESAADRLACLEGFELRSPPPEGAVLTGFTATRPEAAAQRSGG